MLISCHSLNASCKENMRLNSTYAFPVPVPCQQTRFNLWKADAHIFWPKMQRAILHQTPPEGNWEHLLHFIALFWKPFHSFGQKLASRRLPKFLLRSVTFEEIFPYCLYCLDRSTPGRLNENGPLNPFLIFETSKLVVNYLSRTSRWTLIQSNQLSTFPVTWSCWALEILTSLLFLLPVFNLFSKNNLIRYQSTERCLFLCPKVL